MITYKEMLKDDDVRKVVEEQGQSVLRKKIVSSVKVQVVKTNKRMNFDIGHNFSFNNLSFCYN